MNMLTGIMAIKRKPGILLASEAHKKSVDNVIMKLPEIDRLLSEGFKVEKIRSITGVSASRIYKRRKELAKLES